VRAARRRAGRAAGAAAAAAAAAGNIGGIHLRQAGACLLGNLARVPDALIEVLASLFKPLAPVLVHIIAPLAEIGPAAVQTLRQWRPLLDDDLIAPRGHQAGTQVGHDAEQGVSGRAAGVVADRVVQRVARRAHDGVADLVLHDERGDAEQRAPPGADARRHAAQKAIQRAHAGGDAIVDGVPGRVVLRVTDIHPGRIRGALGQHVRGVHAAGPGCFRLADALRPACPIDRLIELVGDPNGRGAGNRAHKDVAAHAA